MKLYISADIEGVSGVVHSEHTARDGREHDRARRYMTKEVNASVEAALEAGATDVVVNDSHGTMRNLLLDELHPEAQLISGSPKKFAMVEGLNQDFDAAIFIGYHTRMGTDGILNHTFHGRAIKNVKINGVDYGEFGLNAAVAGYYGVPVVMVSGCNLLGEEAKELIPSIQTAIVKQTINRTTAQNLSTEKAYQVIKDQTAKGLQNKDAITPFVIEGPHELEVSFLHTGLADMAEILPAVTRKDATTVSVTTENILESYRYVRSLIMMVGSGV